MTATDPAGLAALPAVHDLRVDGETVTFDVDADPLDVVMRTLAGLGLRSLVSAPPSLEQLFQRHYGQVSAGAGVR